MFNFIHTEDKEMSDTPLVPGNARFKIIGVYSTTKDGKPLLDRDGDPKLNVSLSVKDSVGSTGLLYESLTKNTGWKIKAMLCALGLEGLYDKSGNLNPDDIVGGEGLCTLKMQDASNGYEARIVVDKYIRAAKQAVVKVDYSNHDDSIPF
jgi:hypothetical protein